VPAARRILQNAEVADERRQHATDEWRDEERQRAHGTVGREPGISELSDAVQAAMASGACITCRMSLVITRPPHLPTIMELLSLVDLQSRR